MNQEMMTSRNIYSSFQLAKMVVTKVNEIEAKEKKVILVADDEPLTFKIIDEFFQNANFPFHMLQAPNGKKAYTIALSQKPDLIITDWFMPELNGLELIKQLKANPLTRDTPMIMITGALFHHAEHKKILDAGATACIRKPFDEMELVASVRTALALNDEENEIEEKDQSIRVKNQFEHFYGRASLR
jgi:putative two-component system response regulator